MTYDLEGSVRGTWKPYIRISVIDNLSCEPEFTFSKIEVTNYHPYFKQKNMEPIHFFELSQFFDREMHRNHIFLESVKSTLSYDTFTILHWK